MAARVRPSGMDTTAWCGASLELQERYPELEDSDKAREGNAAHHYVAGALLGNPPAIGSLAPNGWPIDAEMVEGGNLYLTYCRGLMAAGSPTLWARVEQPVTMHRLIHPECEGTPDFALVDAQNRTIVVPDYKYGHRPVDPYRRFQGLCYVAGVLEAMELTEAEVADWKVVLAIIQPRSYHPDGPVRTWEISGADAFRWIGWLSSRAYHALSGQAQAETGEHCYDCSARVHCAAFQHAAGAAMEFSREAFAADLPDVALGLQLKLVKRAMARLKGMETGLEELARVRLKAGAVVPYFGITPKKGNLSWNDPAEAMALGAALGLNFRKPPMTSTVITPTQAIKDHGLDATLIDAYATRKTSFELTEIDEATAAKAFGG